MEPDVSKSQWVDLVWALQEPWPHPRQASNQDLGTSWDSMPGLGGLDSATALVERAKRGTEGAART